jgi:hypothetical protein
MKPFTPEQKQIDRTLSPSLVKGGQHARNKDNTRFAFSLAAFTVYPTR